MTERLQAPAVALTLAPDRAARTDPTVAQQGLEAVLNGSERQAEYATSVLLTNSFLLTTQTAGSTEALGQSGNRLAFASLSQLVASQLNRYLAGVVPGLELTFGLQGETTRALDVTYGVALRLLGERLVIRGEGVLQSENTGGAQGLEGEFVVEVRLSPAVSVEVFYRREDAALQIAGSGGGAGASQSYGASLAYRTRFASWRALLQRLGW